MAVPENSGAIVFTDPRPGARLSAFQGKGVNAGHEIKKNPKVGSLIVFPNWLEHAVEVHRGIKPRISIGMNAVMANN